MEVWLAEKTYTAMALQAVLGATALMNGNVCFQLLPKILSLVYTSMFVVIFVTVNFSAEAAKNGACIAVVHPCVCLSTKRTFLLCMCEASKVLNKNIL